MIAAVSSAVGVFYNYTHELECNDFRRSVNEDEAIVYNNWNHQYCTEMFQIWATDGGKKPTIEDISLHKKEC